ncbi:MAG: amino acid permease, partial [Bacteroidota bacterium]
MNHLKKSLSPLLLWGIGVGNVISGMYFGWNLGLEKGGTYGMAIATGIVIILYICFSYSYAELACAIPKAGGGFDYASRAFGPNIGFITGLSQILIYLFTPPAIAIGIGTNLHLAFPSISIVSFSIFMYFIFTGINVLGVKLAATIELTITILALLGLLLFASITLPEFSVSNLSKNPSIGGFEGVLAAIPFAIWFFLGIEGLANVAEESENPQKDLSNGFSRAILTLIFLCFLTFICAVGFNGWESVVYNNQGELSDSPLTLVIDGIYGKSHFFYTSLIYISILGLVASFHGCILAGGRATFEFARY